MCRKLRIGEVRPVATLRQTKSQLNFVWEKDGEDAPTLQLADQEARAAASLCAHVELTEIHEEYARSGKRTCEGRRSGDGVKKTLGNKWQKQQKRHAPLLSEDEREYRRRSGISDSSGRTGTALATPARGARI
jgi:hypothetical protein